MKIKELKTYYHKLTENEVAYFGSDRWLTDIFEGSQANDIVKYGGHFYRRSKKITTPSELTQKEQNKQEKVSKFASTKKMVPLEKITNRGEINEYETYETFS